ncbi:MAG: protein kinase [Archangium sp.]|nr:protein kinase [Archangium sp.]
MSDRDDLGKTLPRTGETRQHEPGKKAAGAPAEELPLQQEGRYALPEGVTDPELGRGGMGRVLTLMDTHLKREVAVKELLLQHTAARSTSGPLLENLFVREARVLALLEHPGIVPVYELGRRADGAPYYAMRKIRGHSLQRAEEQCVNIEERLALLSHFIDVAQTVGYAHSKGIVHRDLKPENVMVSRFGETQVIDWGLALIGNEPPEGGVLAGTPSYMAPEAAAGTSVDARSDVWALGIMLFELLSGKLPFGGSGPSEILDAVRTLPVPDVKSIEPDVPIALREVIARALQRDPMLRYQNAGDMADALEAAQRARAPKPYALYGAVGVLAVAVIGFGVMALSASGRVENARRDARLAISDAQRASADSIATSAVAALRERDTLRAAELGAKEPNHPLARGVNMLAEERGVPEKKWSVKVEAGCASVAAIRSADGSAAGMGTNVACATFGGVALYAADGALIGKLPTGPTGWQHAVVTINDTTLASGGDDRLVHFWDMATRVEARHVDGFSAPIRALAYDGVDVIAGLGDGNVIRIKPDGSIEEVTKHPRPVTRVAALPGVVSSVSEGLLRVTGSSPMELDRHVGAVAAINAKDLVVGVERSVLVVTDGVANRISDGHRDDVTALTVVPADEKTPSRLVSGSADGTVRWWYAEGTPEGVLSVFSPGVQALAATTDGRLIVATTKRMLEVWTLPPRSKPPDPIGLPTTHAWWPQAGLVSGYRDGHVRRVDPETGEVHEMESRHLAPVRVVARTWNPTAPENLRFLSGGEDGAVLAQRWNGSVEPLDSIAGAKITALTTSRTGDLAAWAADDGTRVVWNLALGKEVSREKDTLVRSLAFSHDGRILAVGRDDKHVELFDAQTGKMNTRIDPIDGAVTGLAFSPDGALLAAGSSDGRVTLWNAKGTPSVAFTFNQPQGRVSTLDFHKQGTLLAAGSDDGKAYIFSPQEGVLLAEIPVDAGDVLLTAFTDDALVVVGSNRVAHHLHP